MLRSCGRPPASKRTEIDAVLWSASDHPGPPDPGGSPPPPHPPSSTWNVQQLGLMRPRIHCCRRRHQLGHSRPISWLDWSGRQRSWSAGEIGGEASGNKCRRPSTRCTDTGSPVRWRRWRWPLCVSPCRNWNELRRLVGGDFGARRPPVHVALADQKLRRSWTPTALHNSTPGFSARWLSRAELRRAEPRVRRRAGGLWTDGKRRVDRPTTRGRSPPRRHASGCTGCEPRSRGSDHSDGTCETRCGCNLPAFPAMGRDRLRPVVRSAGSDGCRALPVEPRKGELLLVRADRASSERGDHLGRARRSTAPRTAGCGSAAPRTTPASIAPPAPRGARADPRRHRPAFFLVLAIARSSAR